MKPRGEVELYIPIWMLSWKRNWWQLVARVGPFGMFLNLGSHKCTKSSIIKWINFVKFFLLSFLKGNIFYWRSYLMITYCVLSSLQKILRASCLSIFRVAYMVSSILLFYRAQSAVTCWSLLCYTSHRDSLKNFSDNECSMKRFSRSSPSWIKAGFMLESLSQICSPYTLHTFVQLAPWSHHESSNWSLLIMTALQTFSFYVTLSKILSLSYKISVLFCFVFPTCITDNFQGAPLQFVTVFDRIFFQGILTSRK